MRRLVTVRKVTDLRPIEGADFIELAIVDGWQCVVKKGEFAQGDYGLYFEIDSAIPADRMEFSFLGSSSIRKMGDSEYYIIKTRKMKKQLSQGLLLPVSEFMDDIHQVCGEIPESIVHNFDGEPLADLDYLSHERVDISSAIGVQKYEKPITVRSDAAGGFPSHLFPKTDQERIQNVFGMLKSDRADQESQYAATLKIDGSSGSYMYTTNSNYFSDRLVVDEDGGQLFVCSRNQLLKTETAENRWLIGAQNVGLIDRLKRYHLATGDTIAIQGELVGPGIQGSREGFVEYRVIPFSAWSVDDQRMLTYSEFHSLMACCFPDIQCAPFYGVFKLKQFQTLDQFLGMAESIDPVYAKIPEGLVFHRWDAEGDHPMESFKVISNKFLLKHDK